MRENTINSKPACLVQRSAAAPAAFLALLALVLVSFRPLARAIFRALRGSGPADGALRGIFGGCTRLFATGQKHESTPRSARAAAVLRAHAPYGSFLPVLAAQVIAQETLWASAAANSARTPRTARIVPLLPKQRARRRAASNSRAAPHAQVLCPPAPT